MIQDETLVARLKGRAQFCIDRGEVKSPELLEEAAVSIEALNIELKLVKGERTRIKNTLINLLLSADSGDQEEIAWAIQLVRDDIAREGDPVNDRR